MATSQQTSPARLGYRRKVIVLIVMLSCLALLSFASVALGARAMSLPTVIEGLRHVGEMGRTSGDTAVVLTRIPRTVAAILVGLCLGLAGTAMQGVTRNPLADPGILGVNAGAALAVVGAVVVLGVGSFSGYLWFAFIGAAVASVVVYSVASLGREGATPVKLALAGAAVTAGVGSLIHAALLSNVDALNAFRNWNVGDVGGAQWPAILTVLPFMVVGTVILLFTGRTLNGLALGDDVARGLGQNPAVGRLLTGLGAVLLCGSATALVGPVGFVGLVVPHLLRALVGTNYSWLLPYSALCAPILVLAADVLGRVVLPPSEVPAGIILAIAGAPFFIYMVRSRKAVTL